MMRKTILLLINGFGIEKKDSAAIYNGNLMPNLDHLTKNYLFGSLETGAGDYNNGYRLFSIPEKPKNAEDKIDQMIFDKTLSANEVLKSITTSIGTDNKLHVFYTIDTGKKFNQVKELLRTINPDKNKTVFVHLIMTSPSTTSYDEIIKTISKLAFDVSAYAKVGMVIGKNKINSDDALRTFYKEFGEHWNESVKKFEVLKKEIISPEDAVPFHINKGFSFKENDSVFFLNFEDIDIDRFYNDFTKVPVNKFSLYEFKDDVTNAFTRDKGSSSCVARVVEEHGIKLLLLTTKERINDINFYLNGMEKKKSPNIVYALNDTTLFSSKKSVADLLNNNPYDGIILDFDIGGYNKVEDIKSELSRIDAIIKSISDASFENNYTFIVSSLYGMYAQVTEGVVPKVINFSGKVPCIFQSNLFGKGEYAINGGDIYGLGLTFLTNIDDTVKSNKIIHKKGQLEKMLAKK